MRPNRIKARWQAGQAVVNGWLTIGNPFTAELMAHLTFDSLTIDMQHGVVGYQTAVTMLQAVSTREAMPLVRVPWNDPGMIMKVLDAGAYGVICPMVNSRAEAEAFVGACLYPPQGYRSHGPHRATLYAGGEYPDRANEVVLPIAMIETAEAVANLDDILSVPGLGGIYVGPADLSRSYGGSERTDLTAPDLVAALELILARAQAHGIPAGIHTGTTAYARQMIDKGWQLVTVRSDASFLQETARQVLAEMERSADAKASGPY
jgi:4-hydroxy-2-oxoheptanedioate aldolase